MELAESPYLKTERLRGHRCRHDMAQTIIFFKKNMTIGRPMKMTWDSLSVVDKEKRLFRPFRDSSGAKLSLSHDRMPLVSK